MLIFASRPKVQTNYLEDSGCNYVAMNISRLACGQEGRERGKQLGATIIARSVKGGVFNYQLSCESSAFNACKKPTERVAINCLAIFVLRKD